MNRGREIRQHAQKYFHSDKNYAEFLGNFSELMYNIDKREEAIEVVKEGLTDSPNKFLQSLKICPHSGNSQVKKKKMSDHSILMPPPLQEGGLIKMPKKNPEVADHQFKVPDSLGKCIFSRLLKKMEF